MMSILANAHKLDALKNQTPIEISVTYKDSAKHEYEANFHLDFGELEGLWQSALD